MHKVMTMLIVWNQKTDTSMLQLVLLAGLLIEYNFETHIPSDVAIDKKFLPPSSFKTQKAINEVESWTKLNLMKLNSTKCQYMIFTRSEEEFTTRLKVGKENMEQVSVSKLLGVWISEVLSWSRNCKEICKKAYSRLSMITKLKYVGVKTEDLLDIYILFIRSIVEYCSVVFHSSLTSEQSNKLETIQRTCLKVILGEMYVDYSSALEMCGLDTLYNRREKRCLDFALKSSKHPRIGRMFPRNEVDHEHSITNSETFKVNFARTEKYRKSAIPYCQRLLNEKIAKK